MRLLLVNYEYPPLGGGAGNATAHLSRELTHLGASVCVLTSAFRDLPRYAAQHGFSIKRVPVVRRYADRCTAPEMLTFLLSATLAAMPLARHWQPQATIAFFGIPSGPVGLALKLAFGIPYLVSLRGGDVPGHYDMERYRRLAEPAIRLIWRQAATVVANSRGLQALAHQSTPEIPVQVIPNGVDGDRFRPAFRPRTSGPVRLLFVGRVVYQKGLDVLLQALAQLPTSYDITLDIVGDGNTRASLEALTARLKLSHRVRFSGWQPREAIIDYYRAADVFVLPSRDEGMPNVVLEAMACGLPVIATRVPGCTDLVCEGETGLLVPLDDPSALAQALTILAGSAAPRQRMGEAARQMVETHYTWQQVAQSYYTLIKQLTMEPGTCVASVDR